MQGVWPPRPAKIPSVPCSTLCSPVTHELELTSHMLDAAFCSFNSRFQELADYLAFDQFDRNFSQLVQDDTYLIDDRFECRFDATTRYSSARSSCCRFLASFNPSHALLITLRRMSVS